MITKKVISALTKESSYALNKYLKEIGIEQVFGKLRWAWLHGYTFGTRPKWLISGTRAEHWFNEGKKYKDKEVI